MKYLAREQKNGVTEEEERGWQQRRQLYAEMEALAWGGNSSPGTNDRANDCARRTKTRRNARSYNPSPVLRAQ